MANLANTFSRRSFVRGAACLGAAGVAATGASIAWADEPASEGGSFTYADTVAWNAEYDVVVVGFGGAGGISSIYAADNGARVLLCDAAPQGEEGGNTRFAGQMCVTGTDPDGLFNYYKNLAWHFNTDDEMLRTYTDGLVGMADLFRYLGVEPIDAYATVTCPEYPEYEGGETVSQWTVSGVYFDSALWQLISKNVADRAGSIDVWYESPAVHLVQDPQSKTIVGVEIDKKGETVLVRALNGVVLTCGGFECNTEMIQDYLGCARLTPIGGLHNNGDGVRMGIEVGADLWHMEAYESLGMLAGNAWAVEDGQRAKLENSLNTKSLSPVISLTSETYGTGSIFLVGDDGGRFVNENGIVRHGHVYSNGVWRMPPANWAPHMVFDGTQLQELKDDGFIDAEREAKLVSADTIEELAEKIGADPEILAQTLADFNSFAENGRDIKFDRNPESMRVFDGGTVYAAELRPCVLNTQGGPRRNKNAEVLDTAGTPIPHLYSAGELGGITPFQYNSGGNLAECMIFGKIAGTNAATVKDPLPTMTIPQPVASDIRYVAGESGDTAEAIDVELADNERLGVGEGGIGGDIVVKVAFDGDTMTAIEVVSQNETPEIGGKALDALTESVLAANSTEIDTVTGATITSKAFFAAVEDAKAQL